MNYLRHLVRSKGAGNIISRLLMVLKNFGFTRKKSIAAFDRLSEMSAKYAWRPSLFITACLLDHHTNVIRRLNSSNIHIGLHGHYHVDYGLIPYEVQRSEIKTGLEKFETLGLHTSGFRGPFLRSNQATAKAVAQNGILWTSHSVMLHDANGTSPLFRDSETITHLVKEYYDEWTYQENPSIPYWREYCLEIPVSLPDDEILVDRLKISDPLEFASIWIDMLHDAVTNGELLNLLFHPERIHYVATALDMALREATHSGDVWLAPLDEVAQWWQERAAFSFEIQRSDAATHKVIARCSPDASIMLDPPRGDSEFVNLEDDGSLNVSSNFRPVIAFTENTAHQQIEYLKNEGFLLEPFDSRTNPAMVLDNLESLNCRRLLQAVKQEARGPLIRYWRWPNRYRSALSISADVDAITLWDFLRRALHFYKAKQCADESVSN